MTQKETPMAGDFCDVRCERGHFVSGFVARAEPNPIGYHVGSVTCDCKVCGPGVPAVQTFDGEVIGWSWEDAFGDWEPGVSSNSPDS